VAPDCEPCAALSFGSHGSWLTVLRLTRLFSLSLDDVYRPTHLGVFCTHPERRHADTPIRKRMRIAEFEMRIADSSVAATVRPELLAPNNANGCTEHPIGKNREAQSPWISGAFACRLFPCVQY
jgi:hypothetical protein